jgi:hypothetical protein
MAGSLFEAAAREGDVQGTPECQGMKSPAGAQGRLRSSSARARVRPRLSTFETRTSAVALWSAFDAAFVAKLATGHVLRARRRAPGPVRDSRAGAGVARLRLMALDPKTPGVMLAPDAHYLRRGIWRGKSLFDLNCIGIS